MNTTRNGFTVIELILVVMIITILVAISLPMILNKKDGSTTCDSYSVRSAKDALECASLPGCNLRPYEFSNALDTKRRYPQCFGDAKVEQ